MKFEDLSIGRKFISDPAGGGAGLQTRYLLVKIPVAEGMNVLRLCDGQLARVGSDTLVIEVE